MKFFKKKKAQKKREALENSINNLEKILQTVSADEESAQSVHSFITELRERRDGIAEQEHSKKCCGGCVVL